MNNVSVKDSELLIKVGRIICELVEGDQEKTVMIQKISEKIDLEESEVRRILQLGQNSGLIESPTANQVKLGPFGSNYFCSETSD